MLLSNTDESIGKLVEMVLSSTNCCGEENSLFPLSDEKPTYTTIIATPEANDVDTDMEDTSSFWDDVEIDTILDAAFREVDNDTHGNSTGTSFSATSSFNYDSHIRPITIPVTSTIADYDSDLDENDDDEEINNIIVQPRVPLTEAEEQDRDYQRLLAEWKRAEAIKPKVANYWKAVGTRNKDNATVVPVHENRKPATVTFAYNLCKIRKFSWQEEPIHLQEEEIIEDKSLKGFDDVVDVFIRCQPSFRIPKPRIALSRKEGSHLRRAVMCKDVIDNAYSIWKACMGMVCDELVCSSTVLRKEKIVSTTKSIKSTPPRKDGHLIGNYEAFKSSPLRQCMVADEESFTVEDCQMNNIPDLILEKEISPPVIKRKRSPNEDSSVLSSSMSSDESDEDSVSTVKRHKPQVLKSVNSNGKCSIKLRLCLKDKNN